LFGWRLLCIISMNYDCFCCFAQGVKASKALATVAVVFAHESAVNYANVNTALRGLFYNIL
jgi:hypothetical protein